MSKFFPSMALGITLLVATAPAHAAERDLKAEEANRQIVLDFYDRFFNKHETAEAAAIVVNDYKQHNPNVPDGKKVLVDFFTDFFKKNPDYRVNIVRTATDGDLVYLHVHAQRAPSERGSAVVDIFRVRDGKIIEHWDVVQPVPEKAANENTMF